MTSLGMMCSAWNALSSESEVLPNSQSAAVELRAFPRGHVSPVLCFPFADSVHMLVHVVPSFGAICSPKDIGDQWVVRDYGPQLPNPQWGKPVRSFWLGGRSFVRVESLSVSSLASFHGEFPTIMSSWLIGSIASRAIPNLVFCIPVICLLQGKFHLQTAFLVPKEYTGAQHFHCPMDDRSIINRVSENHPQPLVLPPVSTTTRAVSVAVRYIHLQFSICFLLQIAILKWYPDEHDWRMFPTIHKH